MISVNGKTGYVILTKEDIQLGNVDNTSDDDKPVSAATQAALDAMQAAPTWTAPTLVNGWANFGGGFNSAGYYKRGGRVYLRGMIAGGTVGMEAFVLPTGFRPPARELHTAISNNALGRVDVLASGNVQISTIASNVFISLDGISFAHT